MNKYFKFLLVAFMFLAVAKSENELNETAISKRTTRTKETNLMERNLTECESLSNQIKELKDQIAKLTPASSCLNKSTGIHKIKVTGLKSFGVSCDSQLAVSGWTVIQRRKDGAIGFNRNWTEYVKGFGNRRGEFFIGLKKLHLITRSAQYELYIYGRDKSNNSFNGRFDNFRVGGVQKDFELRSLGKYSGSFENTLRYDVDAKFSTPDRDNDNSFANCAERDKSGWWFDDCHWSLNGEYEPGVGVEWNWKKLTTIQMMIRPKSNEEIQQI